MKAPAGELVYKRLRAPALSGEKLLDPALPAAVQGMWRNAQQLSETAYDVQGRSLHELRAAARLDACRLAAQYTSEYRNLPSLKRASNAATWTEQPLLLSGHQPWLFHPGVWFKNFVLSEITRGVHGTALNVIIDNDLCPSPSITVPKGSRTQVQLAHLACDQNTLPLPFEERAVLDDSAFSTFGDRVVDNIGPLVKNPLIKPLWVEALLAAKRTDNLGQRLAQARHQLEARWNMDTFEVPLSHLCQTESFRWFTVHLLAHLPRFVLLHNRALEEYRIVNRIRSQAHPFPNLKQREEWLEAPFWVWTQLDPQRRALHIRHVDRGLELSDHHAFRTFLPLDQDRLADDAVEQLSKLSGTGVTIRPRAVTTTMSIRLLLADLFIHGIGGDKYDQLTDVLITRFFGIHPPSFLTATATAWLPVIKSKTATVSLRNINRQLRELRFHAERHIKSDKNTQALIAEKHKWIHTNLPRGQRLSRHRGIETANVELQRFVSDQRSALQEQRQRALQQVRREQVLGSREYAFCLFPEETLQPLLANVADLAESATENDRRTAEP